MECCCEFNTSCALTKHQLIHVKTEADQDCDLQWNFSLHSPDVVSSKLLKEIDNLDSTSLLNDRLNKQIIVHDDENRNVEEDFIKGDGVLNASDTNTCISQLNSFSCRSEHELSTSFHPLVELNSIYKCNACEKTFLSKSQLINHLREETKSAFSLSRNDKEGLVQKQNLNKDYVSVDKQIASQNVDLISNTKQLQRKTRNKFLNLINLPVHSRIHPKHQPYCCFTCNKSFNDPSNYRRHLLHHKGNFCEKKFVCSKCGNGFCSSFALRRHLLSHEVASFQCNECGKKFKYKDSLRTHHLCHRKKFECKCGIAFSGKRELLRHMRNKHGIGLQKGSNKKFKCETCGKSFLYPSDLERHILIHTKQCLFECDNCKRKFNVKSNLVKHIQICYSLLWRHATSRQSVV